jgi:hypothetical protein
MKLDLKSNARETLEHASATILRLYGLTPGGLAALALAAELVDQVNEQDPEDEPCSREDYFDSVAETAQEYGNNLIGDAATFVIGFPGDES